MKIERTNNNLFVSAQKNQTDMKKIKEVLEPVQIIIKKDMKAIEIVYLV